MALIGNYSVRNKLPTRTFGDNSVMVSTHAAFAQPHVLKNRYYGQVEKKNATPNGYLSPGAWVLPQRAGGISSYKNHFASGSVLVDGNAGLPIAASIFAGINLTNAALGLIVSLAAAISASGTISSANLAASLQLIANLSASGSLTNAQLGAIVGMVTNLQASGNLTATALVGSFMSWNVGGPAPLSAEGLAKAVWDELTENHSLTGSFSEELKKKLNLSDYIGLK